jgi:hypothetical protein
VISPCWQRQCIPLKHQSTLTRLHGATCQKTLKLQSGNGFMLDNRHSRSIQKFCDKCEHFYWVVTLCAALIGRHRFRETHCLFPWDNGIYQWVNVAPQATMTASSWPAWKLKSHISFEIFQQILCCQNEVKALGTWEHKQQQWHHLQPQKHVVQLTEDNDSSSLMPVLHFQQHSYKCTLSGIHW